MIAIIGMQCPHALLVLIVLLLSSLPPVAAISYTFLSLFVRFLASST